MDSPIAVTSEYVPSGEGLPPWLFQALCEPTQHAPMMVLHSTELHRQRTLERLHQAGVSVAPQYHLTLNSLIRLLHVDLRLPVLLDDEASTFMALHGRCVEAAEATALPFLYTPGVGAWTLTKTRRLQRLHGELMQLRNPFKWEGDPGAAVFHDLCLEVEKAAGGTLPALITMHVLEALRQANEPPFHLSDIAGVVVLDMAPDFTEIEQDLLLAIAQFCPVHQFINPGSFRLGFHGAYLVDEPPCTAETLPAWLPPHEPWTPEVEGWQTDVGLRHTTEITRLTLDERSQAMDAALTLIQAYKAEHDGEVLVVDASARDRSLEWSSALSSIGMTWHPGSSAMNQQPLHHAVVRAASLAQGMSSWSLSSLRSVFFSATIPLLDDAFPGLNHPTEGVWRPRPDAVVLEEIARNFHVLGGPGAIARWLGVLSSAEPSFAERRPEEKARALEETQWWLACLLHTWAPLLSPEDRHLLKHSVVGCTSGATLPLPDSPSSGMGWLSWFVSSVDVGALSRRRAPFDAGVGALQGLIEAMNGIKHQLQSMGLPFDDDGSAFVDLLEHIGATANITHQSSRTNRLHVVSPEDALGCTADLILLVGVDVDAWSMKSATVPWLDAPSRLELGLFQTDRAVRRGRHHLRHLLNAGRHLVVFDSSPEEGGGPSAPLAEWLSDQQRSKAWDGMRAPPSFLPPTMYEGDEGLRSFAWVPREEGHGSWLTPVVYASVETENGTHHVRQGFSGRNRRQQLGSDLQAGLQGLETLHHPTAVLHAFEGAVQADRRRRQPLAKRIGEGETFAWERREDLLSVDAVTLRPTPASLKVQSVAAGVFPHLGYRGEKSVSLSVDPRPLPLYSATGTGLDHRFGQLETAVERDVWSPSRLEGWLKCPRQAWMRQTLRADDDEGGVSEDVDARVRGQIVHDAEAALLQGHGVPLGEEVSGEPKALHAGPMGKGRAGWDTILAFLEEKVHWLGRQNAVSVHRTKDLIDATTEAWQAHKEGELELPQEGRLARLLEADLSLRHAAPVAVEWSPTTETERSVLLDTDPGEETSGFRLFGYADRVDVLVLPATIREALTDTGVLSDASHDTPFPLHGQPRPAQRLVVIRDLKTVAGPKQENVGMRHMRCLFEDLQLALYARAWELLHPNDRVVGVGASEVGEFTKHHVELDADLLPYAEHLELGDISGVFANHFPAETLTGEATTPFRRWMAERLAVAQRAVDTAAQGHVNPTPGAHCKYCSIAHSCAVSDYSGGDF